MSFFYVSYSGPDDEFGVAYCSLPAATKASDAPPGTKFDLRDGEASDYLANDMGWRLCSAKMRNVVDAHLPSLLDAWLPVSVTEGGSERAYSVLLAPDASDALHRDRSIYSRQGRLVKPVIDRERVGEREVFTVGERDLTMIVTESVRSALESAGCTGIRYELAPSL